MGRFLDLFRGKADDAGHGGTGMIHAGRPGTMDDTPATLPSAPNDPWTATIDEQSFQSQTRKTFRTRAFANLSQPGSPAEFLQAARIDGGWQLMMDRVTHDEADDTTTHKTKILAQNISFIDVLCRMALFENGTDTSGPHALREEVSEDLNGMYYVDVAHAEGVIFDVRGRPALTARGTPLRDGEFSSDEIAIVKARYDAEEKAKLCPVIIRASELTPIFQEAGKADGFDDFLAIAKARREINSATAILDELFQERKGTLVQIKDKQNVYKTWSQRYIGEVDENEKFSSHCEDAAAALGDDPRRTNVIGAIRDAQLTGAILNAAFSVSYYANSPAYGGSESAIEKMDLRLKGVEELLKSTDVNDGKSAQIRSFIMKNHIIADLGEAYKKLRESLESIEKSLEADSNAILRASQPETQRRLSQQLTPGLLP